MTIYSSWRIYVNVHVRNARAFFRAGNTKIYKIIPVMMLSAARHRSTVHTSLSSLIVLTSPKYTSLLDLRCLNYVFNTFTVPCQNVLDCLT